MTKHRSQKQGDHGTYSELAHELMRGEKRTAPKPKSFQFRIEHLGELGAGIRPFNDTVTITVDSGEPGGDGEGENSFQEHMREALAQWYDGAHVEEVS